jgi:carboxyl-terminal processing protease
MENPLDGKKTRNEKILIIAVVVLSLLVVASCFAIPYIFRSDRSSQRASENSTSSTDSGQGETNELEDVLEDSDAYEEAQSIVEDNYVDVVSGEELLEAGARGIRRLSGEGARNSVLVERGIVAMIDSLDDPFSSYMDAEELEMLDTQLSGRLSGIGVAMQTMKNEIRVVEVLEGTPAQAAGIQEGDIVKVVDGEDVTDMDLNEVVKLIRGPEGSTVSIGMMRPPSSDLIYFDIVRGDIEIPVIGMEMKEGNVGYLRLTDWTEDVDEKLFEALASLREQGAQALVLDLRSNPGGYMEPAIKAADLFLRDGIIVTSQGRVAGTDREYEAEPAVEWDLPVVILVDRGSASSSEIFAAALSDNERAILVGETTFGKGSIQKIFRQDDGSGIRLTVARYYTPNGSSIDDQGIDPDVVVRNPVVGERDLQLEEALKIAQ